MARGCFIFILALCSFARAKPPEIYRDQLKSECRLLMDLMIQKPVGSIIPQPLDDSKKITASFEPLHNPASGLLLIHAGRFLGEPVMVESATQIARAASSAQQPDGRIPQRFTFDNRAVSIDPPVLLPDKSSTRAAMALMLSIVEVGKPEAVESYKQSATRCAMWMSKQQSLSGAWPVAYPRDAQPKDATKLVRLDTSDTRDSVYAMLLAGQVGGLNMHQNRADRSIAFLMKVRIPEGVAGVQGCWGPLVDPGGNVIKTIEAFPDATDPLASRFCAQTLAGMYVITGNRDYIIAAGMAANSLNDLPKHDSGDWHRFYDFKGKPFEREADNVVDGGLNVDKRKSLTLSGEFGLTSTLLTVNQWKSIARTRMMEKLQAGWTPTQVLSQTLCGLNDQPFNIDWPIDADEAQAWLKSHEAELAILKGDVPGELAERNKRIWWLYQRARIEFRFQI